MVILSCIYPREEYFLLCVQMFKPALVMLLLLSSKYIKAKYLTLKLQCIWYGRGCSGCSKGSSDDPSHLRISFISNIKENLSSDKQCQKFQGKSGICKTSGKHTAIYDPACKLPECWTLQISPFYVYRSSRILPVK